MRTKASKNVRANSSRKLRRASGYRPLFETLENRLALATVFGLTDANVLVRFDSAAPFITSSLAITGLVSGDTVQGIDFRPATGQLFALGVNANVARLYTINLDTAVATAVGGGATVNTIAGATAFGFDFNPTVDRIRVVNDLASDGAGGNANNFRLNPNDGTLVAVDADLDFTGLAGGNANAPVTGVAYENSFAGTTTTRLLGIATGGDRLVVHGGAAPGFPTLQNVGLLGFDTSNEVGFDIQALAGGGNAGFAALQTNVDSEFYTINLTTGAATLVGDIAGATVVRDIAVVPEILPGTILFGVDQLANLTRFNSALPSVVLSTIPITGLAADERLNGIDFRPATGQLFALTRNTVATGPSRLYTVNTTTGAATQVGTDGAFLLSEFGSFGFDFNPVPDRIRVTGTSDQNLRLNPADGTLTMADGTLIYDNTTADGDPIDPNAGANPTILASAYTNSFAGASTTTLYDLDIDLDILVIQNPPNSGTLNTVGSLGVNIDNANFDIQPLPGGGNRAFAWLAISDGEPGLYTIDLATGAATLLGVIGTVAERGLAVAPAGTIQFSAPTYSVGESGPVATITVNRVGGSEGSVTVRVDTTNGTALAPGDYADSDQVLIFGPGVTSQTFTIPIVNDTDDEPDETINLALSSPTGGAELGTQSTAVLTITDNDPPAAANTTTDLTTSDPTTAFGEPVTFTATVTSTTTPTGSVTFVDTTSGTTLGTVQVNGAGVASLSVNNLGVGVRTIQASFNANANFNGSSDTVTQTVTQGTTTTALDSAPNPSEFGETVTFTAEVDSNAPSTRQPTGNVTFVDTLGDANPANDVVLGTDAVDPTSGEATIDVSTLSVGSHTIEARFVDPSGGYAASSGTAIQTVIDTAPTGFPDCEVTTLNVPGDSGTATLEDDADNPGSGAIIVTGTSRGDVIVIEPRPTNRSQIRVKINGQLAGIFDSSDVERIVAFGLTGNDKIIVNASLSVPATLFGDQGNDFLYGGKGADGLEGGSGTDRLFGGSGDDTLCGGDGNDFIYGQAGNDFAGGDAGNDKVFGEVGNDFLLGNDGNDFVFGGSGHDRMFGQAGNDQLFGEAGNDIGVGGEGNDKLFGGSGRDVLIGGDGADTLFGETHDDILVAGFTTHDEDDEALQAILAEWTSRNDYATRVDNIRNGTGDNGPFTLDDTTVSDDGLKDTLWGDGGLDWFLFGDGDKLKDKSKNELLN